MSPKIKLPDLSDVEDVGTFNDMPKGLYVMKIREMTTSETGDQSKFPGQPMGVVVLDPVRVVGGAKVKKGEYQGLFHRFPLDDQNPGWTPRLKEFVTAIGGKVKGGTLDEKAVEGKLVIAKVKDGKAEDGERRAELDKLMPYTEEAAGGAADDDDDESDDLWTEEELGDLNSDELREAAEELDVEVPKKLTSKNKKGVIAAILEAQDDEDEDEDEGEDEDEDDEPWDEESLLALGRSELTEVAGEFEVEMPGRLTTAAKKRVVDAILEAAGGEDEDEDEDGENETYEEDDLTAMSLADLKTVATDEFELDVPKGKPGVVKKKLVAAILAAQEEAEDEDEDESEDEDDGYDELSKTEAAKEVRSRNGKVKKGMSLEAMIEWLRANDAEDEDEDEDEDEEMDPDEMSVDEIKVALRERGIAVKGSEKVLRAKLVKSLESDDDGDPF